MISPKAALRKAASLIVVGVLAGWLYGRVSPWMFPPDREMGFGFGMLHGAMMPIALPSLLMGRNVDIFASGECGRLYKIGYIAGINLCGLLFFGTAFWKPERKRGQPAADLPQADNRSSDH